MKGYSTQFLAVIVSVLSVILPKIGVQIGDDELTKTIQTILAIVTGLWIAHQRTKLQKAPIGHGDVNLGGFRR